MKNALLIIVSVVVGYGFAYLSASNEWAPFGKTEGSEVKVSETSELTAGDSSSGKQKFKKLNYSEVLKLSNNYVAWVSYLSNMASKGVSKKDLSMKFVIRGGTLSAGLIAELAKANRDIHYSFGKEYGMDPIYMMFSASETPSGDNQQQNEQLMYYVEGDTASMCPPICPIQFPVPVPIPVPEPPIPPTPDEE